MDLNVFDYDYLPKRLPGRDKEINELSFILSSFENNARGGLVLISGKSGTGKTATVKYVLNRMKKELSIPYSYINCAYDYTALAIINKISDNFDLAQSRRGKAFDEIFDYLMKNIKKGFIVVLDEADMLFKKSKDGNDLIYKLLRTKEVYSIPSLVIVISNDVNFSLQLDYRVRSMLISSINFVPYKPSILRKIIEERANLAGISVPKEVIDVCVGFSARLGDARQGITLLYKSILEAIRDNEPLTIEHAYKAKKSIEITLKEREILDLNDDQKKIFLLINKKKRITSRELYSSLGMSERTIRKYLTLLLEKGLIKQEYINDGKGRRRVFYV